MNYWMEEFIREQERECFAEYKKLNIPNVRNNISFNEQMKQDIIPRIWQMAEKEKEHLNWLIDNNAPKEMIETSRKCLSHFIQRHKEYTDYVEKHGKDLTSL